ncbi:MAG: hypothetical protein KC656_05160 [Myxococcales bacterium]|nr:hypothetical protein [Myxococcales bacterium]MCB9672948.1 hypothetical protein [Alphaproteobacteria bacterium]
MARRAVLEVEEISRDLDLVVFQLERKVQDDALALLEERRTLRRELERLRDRLTDVARELEGG